MEILLIWPKGPAPFQNDYDKNKLFFRILSQFIPFRKPVTYSILAALTPNKHNVTIIEGGFSDIDFDKKYDIVGITSTTDLVYITYKIADEFIKRGTTVVIGGWHASALPFETKKHADSVVIGEAEETWPELIKDFQKGTIKPFYNQKRPVDAKLIPALYNVYPKERGLGIHATRGCPNCCKFCSITNMKFRKIYRMRPISNVVKEISSSSNKVFAFQDASLTINPKYTKELFRKIIGLNKKFVVMGNIDTLGKDDELLKLASEAGCLSWQIGFESICQDSLNSVNKTKNIVKDYSKNIKKIQDYNIAVEGAFIFGFDHDTINIFDETDDFIRKNELKMAYANALTPFPGTPLFDQLDSKGRILTKDWSKYDGHNYVVFQPKHMSPDELLYNVQELEQKWHSNSRAMNKILKSLNYGIYNFFDVVFTEIGWKSTKNQLKKN